jgi:hypothetical protein
MMAWRRAIGVSLVVGVTGCLGPGIVDPILPLRVRACTPRDLALEASIVVTNATDRDVNVGDVHMTFVVGSQTRVPVSAPGRATFLRARASTWISVPVQVPRTALDSLVGQSSQDIELVGNGRAMLWEVDMSASREAVLTFASEIPRDVVFLCARGGSLLGDAQ